MLGALKSREAQEKGPGAPPTTAGSWVYPEDKTGALVGSKLGSGHTQACFQAPSCCKENGCLAETLHSLLPTSVTMNGTTQVGGDGGSGAGHGEPQRQRRRLEAGSRLGW